MARWRELLRGWKGCWGRSAVLVKQGTVRVIPREIIEDREDYYLATQVLERVRSGQEKVYSSSDARKELGLDD